MLSKLKKEEGQALVETAVALPIVLILFLGAIEFVHWNMARVVVKEAAFEAGREAFLDHDDIGQARLMAKKICAPLGSGETIFRIDHADEPALKNYVVSCHLKALFPLWTIPVVTQSVPALLFDSGT